MESTARILDGRKVADELIGRVAKAIGEHVDGGGDRPGLAVVLVGDHPASEVYVGNKIKACERAGIASRSHRLPAGTSQEELLALVDYLNDAPDIHGILVQLPLPKGLDEREVTHRIRPDKDVDGFHALNVGRLALREPGLRPCTPKGVMTLLRGHGIEPKGMNATVVGASNIVGRPLALELLLAGATVTICHRFTHDLHEHVGRAELLCVAVGKQGVIESDWIAEGAVAVDIGISRNAEGKLHGDLDHDSARRRAGWITPVPGGVGPMTVATLMQNTAEAAGIGVEP